jgi:glycosyltransferase involved in cell wall biosynthesis
MVIVEAMSCGLPVVSFDCPTGPREIIQDGHDGVLVKLGDVSAFANGLARLMDEPDTRKRMGKAARLSSRRFALDLVGRQWIELIESLHSAKSAPQTVFSC